MMETNRCEKCGKETRKNRKICENCKKSRNENWMKVGKGLLGIAGTVFFVGVSKNKMK